MSILGNPVCLPIGGKAAKGSRMFLAVSLPRSLYYTQAAEWLKVKDNPRAGVNELQWDGQVVCDGSLWELHNNKAYCYSLENGELLETVPLTGASGQQCNGICTDGESRIWFVRIGTEISYAGGRLDATYQYNLYEFNVGTKAVKSLYQSNLRNLYSISSSSSQNKRFDVSVCRLGMIGYSKYSDCVYFGVCGVFGKISSYSTVAYGGIYSTSVFTYDLTSNSMTKETNRPTTQQNSTGAFFYDDGDDFYTGGGFAHANYFRSTNMSPVTLNQKEKCIYKYTKATGTWTQITNSFEGYSVGFFSYIQIGDAMLQIGKDATGIFDPKTGNLKTVSTPVIPPDATAMYAGCKAFGDNILYLITNQGVYKCPFFSKVPEDAPIVCKIYKGQKYHTLEPFEIPGKLKLLRTQQVADKDYEIKMYEYSSEGGQTIYIEDVSEK